MVAASALAASPWATRWIRPVNALPFGPASLKKGPVVEQAIEYPDPGVRASFQLEMVRLGDCSTPSEGQDF